MVCSLSDVTVNNSRVLEHLASYLAKISRYPNFDRSMQLRLFVDGTCDFTCVEAIEYMLGFTSSAHKMLDTIRSPYAPVLCSFDDLCRHVNSLFGGGFYEK